MPLSRQIRDHLHWNPRGNLWRYSPWILPPTEKIWKVALIRIPEPNRRMRRGPDPDQPTRRVFFLKAIALARIPDHIWLVGISGGNVAKVQPYPSTGTTSHWQCADTVLHLCRYSLTQCARTASHPCRYNLILVQVQRHTCAGTTSYLYRYSLTQCARTASHPCRYNLILVQVQRHTCAGTTSYLYRYNLTYTLYRYNLTPVQVQPQTCAGTASHLSRYNIILVQVQPHTCAGTASQLCRYNLSYLQGVISLHCCFTAGRQRYTSTWRKDRWSRYSVRLCWTRSRTATDAVSSSRHSFAAAGLKITTNDRTSAASRPHSNVSASQFNSTQRRVFYFYLYEIVLDSTL